MRKENIFYSDEDKSIFLEKLNETLNKYSVIYYAYCLMDNHYHLLSMYLIKKHTDLKLEHIGDIYKIDYTAA